MQGFEIAAIALLVVAAIVFLASRRIRSRSGDEAPATGLMIGSVLGLLGAIVILSPQIDVVPDGWQGSIEPFLIGGITLVLVVGTVYRATR